MRNSAARRSKAGEQPSTWDDDRVGAGMRRWRREFPDIDCSGKAVVGRLLHLREIFLTVREPDAREAPLEVSGLCRTGDAACRGRAVPDVAEGPARRADPDLGRLVEPAKEARESRPNPTPGRRHRWARRDRRADRAGPPLVEPAMRDHAETEQRLVAALSKEEQRVVASALGRDDAQIDSGSTWLPTRAREPRSAGSTTAPGYCSCHRTVPI